MNNLETGINMHANLEELNMHQEDFDIKKSSDLQTLQMDNLKDFSNSSLISTPKKNRKMEELDEQIEQLEKILDADEDELKPFDNATIINLPMGTENEDEFTQESDNKDDSLLSDSIFVNTTPVLSSGPYRCNICNKEFRIMRYLEKHKRIHTGEKPYQCCYCGRHFNDWPNMNRHKRIHTGERPYRCNVCDKTFSQPAVYNEHIKRHTGERPFVCTICSKGFPRAARLTVHMRVHTGERPFQCNVCHRRFSQPHHLSAHIRIHTGDRPYVCDICDMSFACISNLRRHSKQLHKNQSDSKNISCSVEIKQNNITHNLKAQKKSRKSGPGSKVNSVNIATLNNLNGANLEFQTDTETQLLVDDAGNIIIDASSFGLNGALTEELLLGAKILQTSDGRALIVTNPNPTTTQIPIINTNGLTILGNDSQLTQQLFTAHNGTLYAAASNALLSSHLTANTSSDASLQDKLTSILGIKGEDESILPGTANSSESVKSTGQDLSISEQQSQQQQQTNDLLNQFAQQTQQQQGQFQPAMFTILTNGTGTTGGISDVTQKPSILFDTSGNAHQLNTETVYLTDHTGADSFQGTNQVLQLQHLTNSNPPNPSQSSQTQQQQQSAQNHITYIPLASTTNQSGHLQTTQNGQIILAAALPNSSSTSSRDGNNISTQNQQQTQQQQLINVTNGSTLILSGTAANLASIHQILQSNQLINQNATMMVSLLPNNIQQSNDVNNDVTTQAWFTSLANSSGSTIQAQSTSGSTSV